MAREKLICARLNKQLTQEDVASFAGISRSHYALIESGKRTPSLDVAFKISERLNCDISDIFLNPMSHQATKMATTKPPQPRRLLRHIV